MYISIIIKTFILYIFIVLAYRIMGKKEMGNLSIIDFIVSILIAEMAAMSIEEQERSILESIIPITELVIVEITLSFITLKNNKIRDFIDGRPILIINNGKINKKIMKKMRYNLYDLLSQLRELNISNIKDVKYAILENNGKLTAFKNSNYPLPIIIDGNVDYISLKNINKDINWIKNELKNEDINNIFYAFYENNCLHIIK